MRRFAATVLMGACLALLAAPALAAGEYKLGALLAVTGPAGMLGGPEKNSAEMLVEEINRAGGVKGTPIKLVMIDTEGDATKAVTGWKRLAEKEQVLAVIGPTTTGESLALADAADRDQLALVSCAASWKILQADRDKPQRRWVFKVTHSDSLVVEKIYAKLRKEGKTKVALLIVNNGFGITGREELVRLAGSFGITVVADEKCTPGDTDMTTQLTKIAGSGAEAIVCWGTNPEPGIIAKNRKALGMDIPLYNSHGVASKKFIEIAGEGAEGTMLPVGKIVVAGKLPDSDPQKKVLLGYVKDYEERFHEPVSTFGGHGYDSILVLAEALKRLAGSGKAVDRESLRAELERTTGIPGVAGVYSLSPNDHNGLNSDGLVMVRVEKGDWQIITD